MTHFVKVREKGRKAWQFLTSGGVSRLRIHALRFTQEKAEALIRENEADNPEWEFKVVPVEDGSGT